MHELSIAMSIVDAVVETMERENAVTVNRFTLEVGSLAGVDMEALEFALNSAVLNTPLEKAAFDLQEVRAMARCRSCNHEFILEELFSACPRCGSYNPDILSGKELKIKSIEIED